MIQMPVRTGVIWTRISATKEEIVRIADMTEWNGFQLLNEPRVTKLDQSQFLKLAPRRVLSEINFSPVTKNVLEM